jgi:Sec-independent protein translocase protein TatA
MFGLGTTELIVIGAIIFLIFGAKRIPEREFRQIKKEVSPEDSTNQTEGNKESKDKKDPPILENKLTEKVVEQIPGVKKAVDLKKKVDKVKEIIK